MTHSPHQMSYKFKKKKEQNFVFRNRGMNKLLLILFLLVSVSQIFFDEKYCENDNLNQEHDLFPPNEMTLVDQELIIRQSEFLDNLTESITEIRVDGNDANNNWTNLEFVQGEGTLSNPYIIENLTFQTDQNNHISIFCSQAYVEFRNLTINIGNLIGLYEGDDFAGVFNIEFSSNINIYNLSINVEDESNQFTVGELQGLFQIKDSQNIKVYDSQIHFQRIDARIPGIVFDFHDCRNIEINNNEI